MHCIHCGKIVPTDCKFCIHCGGEIKKEAVQADHLLSLNISKTQTLVLYDNYLTYKGERINYSDIQGISYLLTKTQNSINFIPTHNSTSFIVRIEAAGKIYTVDSSTSSFMLFKGKREKEMSEIFGKLVYIFDEVLKPFVIVSLVKKFDAENQLKIGDLLIKPEGLYKPKSFWRKPELLPWKQYYNSTLHQGTLQILKSDPKKQYKSFSALSMDTMNAVVLPDFLDILYSKYGPIKENDTETPEGKINTNKNYCHSCAAPVNATDKFCIHCGSKLI